ncbi:universal stress protein [Kribbella sp. NPDC050124]|uniref:universal stress protein n=1 Tax=Kribbella sp. NPDC050124 TaxID=3364114 RepID=UPI0037B1FCE3
MKLFRGSQVPAATDPEVKAGPDSGPVIVLADEHGADALDWAAAEAAARGSELRIVHAFRWPRVFDPFGTSMVDLTAREAAEAVVTAAAGRAARIAPSLRVTTNVHTGRQITALVAEARKDQRALVVLGHNRGLQRTLVRRLIRRTSASIAVIGLSATRAIGPSAGRVVVGVDRVGGPPEALGYAFRAARRRGTGLTVVHATWSVVPPDIEDAVRIWQMAYPDVDVRWDFAIGPSDSVVLAESAAAALTVLGPDRHGRLHQALRGSSSYDVLRLARGPVVMVGATAGG